MQGILFHNPCGDLIFIGWVVIPLVTCVLFKLGIIK
jgi:hypothetical protein